MWAFIGCIDYTLSYDNFILKIKNTFPIFGYMMHFCSDASRGNFPREFPQNFWREFPREWSPIPREWQLTHKDHFQAFSVCRFPNDFRFSVEVFESSFFLSNFYSSCPLLFCFSFCLLFCFGPLRSCSVYKFVNLSNWLKKSQKYSVFDLEKSFPCTLLADQNKSDGLGL